MIHRFHRRAPEPPAPPRWRLRLAVSSGIGGIVALPVWCFGDTGSPAVWFSIVTGFILSILQTSDIAQKYVSHARAGNWVEERCNTWRPCRRGILIYGEEKDSPSLFLPWASLHDANVRSDTIYLEDSEADTFYSLPSDSAEIEAELAYIRQQIRQHQGITSLAGSAGDAVFCMASPYHVPFLPFLLAALPWFIVGAIIPFIFPGEEAACFFICAFGASLATVGHYNLEEDFCTDCYLGDEVRRTKRGVITRTENGITSFIPWAILEEAIATDSDCVFLRAQGEKHGITLSQSGRYQPVPITRRYRKIHRLTRNLGRLLFVFLAAAASALWCNWWS